MSRSIGLLSVPSREIEMSHGPSSLAKLAAWSGLRALPPARNAVPMEIRSPGSSVM